MANDYYEVNADLQPFTRARSGVLDAEFTGIESGFAKLPSQTRIDSGNSNFVTAGGTANAIAVAAPTTWTGYAGKDGYVLSIKIVTTNTDTVTLNVDGLGAKACARFDGTALQSGDLKANAIHGFVYNESTGKFYVNSFDGVLTDAQAEADAAAASASEAATSETNAATSASNSSTSATKSENYAVKNDGFAGGTDNSSKSWSIGGTGDGQPSAGPAKDWATKTSGNVDGSGFSAKEHALGSQTSTGGSSKNWAQQTGGDVTGAGAGDKSAKSWAQETGASAPAGGSAKEWAVTAEDSSVDGVDFSAFHWAKKAEAHAASNNIPSATGNALKTLRQKSDESGFEYTEQPYTQTAADGRFARLTGGADANFTAMPQVSGAPIVESGSNTDGEWMKLADGTLVMFASVTIPYTSSAALSKEAPYPSIPISAPVATGTLKSESTGLAPDQLGLLTIIPNTSDIALQCRRVAGQGSFVDGDTVVMQYIAIGRWK